MSPSSHDLHSYDSFLKHHKSNNIEEGIDNNGLQRNDHCMERGISRGNSRQRNCRTKHCALLHEIPCCWLDHFKIQWLTIESYLEYSTAEVSLQKLKYCGTNEQMLSNSCYDETQQFYDYFAGSIFRFLFVIYSECVCVCVCVYTWRYYINTGVKSGLVKGQDRCFIPVM